jgi:flavin-dependent dehydrogenase
MREAPYIVIGGGLAGAASALELARNGVPVVILESTRGPHHKVCGEFLSAEAQALVTYLGLDLDIHGASRISTLRLGHGKRCAESPLPFRGAGLSRYRLDQALLEAAEKAGAKLRRGVTVTQISAKEGSVSVKAGRERFEGRGAMLASGKHNIRRYPRALSDMVGFKLQLRVSSGALQQLEDIVQLVMFEGGYVGSCVVEDRLVTLCWVMHRAVLQRIGTDWTSQAGHLAAASALVGELLEGARPQWEKPVAVAGIPYGYLRRETIAPNVYPVGDQLAVIPSFTGDGMSIALYSGLAAAHSIVVGESGVEFQKRLTDRLRPQFRWAGLVNLLFETTGMHGFSVGLAAALPSLVTMIAQSTRVSGFEMLLEGPRRQRQVAKGLTQRIR